MRKTGLTSGMVIIVGFLALSPAAWGRGPAAAFPTGVHVSRSALTVAPARSGFRLFEKTLDRTAARSGGNRETPAASASSATGKASDRNAWTTLEVRPGGSLSALFSRAGLPSADWAALLALGGKFNALRRLHPGDIFKIRKTADGRLAALEYRSHFSPPLHAHRSGNGFVATASRVPAIPYTVRISGHVRDSLLEALQQAGASRSVAYEFIDIFRPRVDFEHSIQSGDRFAFIYDRFYAGHRFVKAGPILAAEITLDGHTLTAFRYTDAKGRSAYYGRDGRALKPALLRTPLRYTQVSSAFSMRRLDPVVHVWRPHTGVDLVAPKGTPIKAAADGRIKFIGRAGGYGKLVILKNSGPYSTRYAHMLRFAEGLHKGSRVRRGQVIGYVGESGEATGPHLHYEIRINGTPENPLTIELPPGKPIAATEKPAFRRTIRPLLAAMGRAYGRSRGMLAGDGPFDLGGGQCAPSVGFRPAIAFAPLAQSGSALRDGGRCEH